MIDWSEIVSLTIAGIGLVGYGVYIGWKAHKRYVEDPYKWICLEEDCHFKVSGNQHSRVLQIADAHMEASHSD